eukprot:gene31786-41254_t
MDRLYTSDDLKVKSCLKGPRDCRTDSPLETNDPGWIQFFSKTHQRPYWKNKTGDTTYNNPFSSKFIPLEKCTGKRKNESSVVDPVKESQLEVDLLCIACQDLVIDAMQITCCGSLFCRGCITPWITDHGSCPCCRKEITIADIFCDVRSERKSANHPRACKLKDRGCKFIGDRHESVLHENQCEYIPVAPLRKKIADLTAELNEAAAERLVSAARIEAAEQQIEAFAEEKARTEAAHKIALQTAVWAVPKSMLRLNQHHLFAVEVMPRIDSSHLFDTYKLRFVYKSRPYICEVRSMIQYDSVSLFLCCDQNVRTGHTQRAQFTLLHPTNPSMNHATNLYATFTSGSRKGQGSGVKKWMNRSQFLSYCMHDSIAAGLSSLYNSVTDSGVDESQCYESSSSTSTSGRDDTDSNSSSSHASSDPYI